MSQIADKVRDDVAAFWIRNANIRHGHVPDQMVTGKQASAPPPVATPTGLPGWAKTALLVGGSAVTGLALPAVLAGLAQPSAAPPAATAAAQPGPDRDGSLYQFLEDNNYHRTP